MSQLSPIAHWCRSAGRPTAARLSRWRAAARRILRRCDQLAGEDDSRLLERSRELRWRARTGQPLTALLPDAFALVRVAARRTLGVEHYPVQLMGGMALVEGFIIEMQTGEGKTLTAVPPLYLRALAGDGCLLLTVNDYLARRDAEWMGPIYRALGLTVGCIQSDMDDTARREAYRQDVTYATVKEVGFDFLRDRLRKGTELGGVPHEPAGEQLVQRQLHFALVDEADSVLIDEARTPLVIGLTRPNDAFRANLLRWCQRASRQLKPSADFLWEPERRSAYLTEGGCRKLLLMGKPSLLDGVDTEQLYSEVEKALCAQLGFERDRDYVICDGQVVIVDESTGRMLPGRKWQDGFHQTVEAKESLPITPTTEEAAQITVQRLLRQFVHVAGMTGTAVPARRELRAMYRLRVVPIPTHRPCIRVGLPPRVFATMQAKREAVVAETVAMWQSGRPVLIGTPSVAASEALGTMLDEAGVPHEILNARYHEQEARIISQAGQPSRVTIATNMAGRGADIVLHEDVKRRGGLHVIATEMHSSRRIDRQLVGRAARQGDPGSFQFFLSLEDELLRCLGGAQLERLHRAARPNQAGELPRRWVRVFRTAQQRMERFHRRQRKQLMRAEDVRMKDHQRMGLDPFLELTD